MSKNTQNKRSEEQKAVDRALITDMVIRNFTLRQMANALNGRVNMPYKLSYQQVDYDLKLLYENWISEAQDNIQISIMKAIRKFDKIEAECWDAWEASKHGRRSTRVGGGVVDQQGNETGGALLERRIETTTGDVRYLIMIERCIIKRAELLGVALPEPPEGGAGVNIDNAIILMEKDAILQEIQKVCKRPILRS